jgi:uncharacterized membrane protein YoaK (UPF0700 family)
MSETYASFPPGSNIRGVIMESIDTKVNLRDWLLFALAFSSGAVDAISYFGLKIFSAFMTGNLVFLGFALADSVGPPDLPVGRPPLLGVICALCAFGAGAYLGTLITRSSSQPSGVWSWRVSATLTFTAVAEAAFLAIWIAAAGRPSSGITNILLILMSLAMGLQTAAVRSLGVQGVLTTAATGSVATFVGDFAGYPPQAERPRLGGILLAIIAGALVGGLLFLHALIYAPALPLAVTILVVLVALFIPREHGQTGASSSPQ